MTMLESAIEWATRPGPPNWVFVVAILTAPKVWSKYIHRLARKLYEQRFGDSA
jgi:hypothetical protein